MNLIEAEVKFYGDEDTSRRLFAAAGDDANVAFNASTGVTELRLKLTLETQGFGDLLGQTREAVEKIESLMQEAKVEQSDSEGVFEFRIHAQELVAIAGNQHRRCRRSSRAAWA